MKAKLVNKQFSRVLAVLLGLMVALSGLWFSAFNWIGANANIGDTLDPD